MRVQVYAPAFIICVQNIYTLVGLFIAILFFDFQLMADKCLLRELSVFSSLQEQLVWLTVWLAKLLLLNQQWSERGHDRWIEVTNR